MIKPTIHLNGDRAETLLDGYREAREAVEAAIEKVAAASPNARNYYVAGEGAITQAIAEHRERLRQLHVISSELLELAEHCYQFVK